MQKAFETIKQLVADFKAQEAAYLSPSYQESRVRQDFIDKFFTALGWDVTHERQKNPYEQEVHIENKVSMVGSQRRADYAFFLAPNFRNPKFFVEAKKPQKNLANAGDYHQTIRYGWNAGTPLAILTDFEEFHILDCRYKPNIDEALNHKIEYFHYSDYANEEKFARLYWLFSREAVAGGSIEKCAAELPKPRGKAVQRGLFKGGYQPVDEAFLEELDGYREQLAKAFKKANEKLEGEELTEAIQRTLDRLVFIRFLEDKQIEEPEIINLRSRESAWKGFLNLCKRMDSKYNGLVFKPHRVIESKEFNPPDDTVFADICDELADPASPYNFDQIPISILGSIYERFLGKVVHATDKRVKVEEKPEVRKAGGVYYTPEYIVRYIVNETVGKLLYGETEQPQVQVSFPNASIGNPEMGNTQDLDARLQSAGMTNEKTAGKTATTTTWKTPEQVAKMAFADIACGSGSFLIEVYSTLLEYHIRYYIEHPEKVKEGDVFERDGKLHLSLKKKKEILTNNIYGVDIDFQATEVTQLSLYLKMLEEATITETHQFGMFKEAILPDLRKNIINGNSLIGRDIMEGSLFPNVDEEKLKPMNFEDAFPNVMKKGGFDAVVGNPPYGYMIPTIEQEYFSETYKHQDFQKDLYLLFLERFSSILKLKGLLGVIISNTWLQSVRLRKIRQYLTSTFRWIKILYLPEKVFKAIVDTHVLVLEKNNKDNDLDSQVQIDVRENNIIEKLHSIKWNLISKDGDPINILANPIVYTIIDKIRSQSEYIVESFNVFNGAKPFEEGKGTPPQTKQIMKEKPFVKEGKKPNRKWRPLLRGSLIDRYINKWNEDYWILYGPWLAAPRDENIFLQPLKIVVRQTGDSIIATLCEGGIIARDNLHLILPKKKQYDLKYILGIINSQLMDFYYTFVNPEKGEALAQVKKQHVEQLPIRTITFDDPQDKSRHDAIVKLVEQMLEAKERLSKAKTEAEVNRLEMLCQSLDHQIDKTVYELYGLTEEEIKIVEGKSS